MSFRRLATLAVLLVGGAGIALWLAQNFFNTWEPQLRSRLEAALSERLQARVHFGGVSLSFFHRLHVRDVEVWSLETPSQLVCRADDISLTFSLIDLPSAIYRRQLLTSIGLISLHNPYIELSPKLMARVRTSTRAGPALAFPPLFTLAWTGGTIHWNTPIGNGASVSFHDVKGFFRVRGPQMDLSIRAATPQAPGLRFDFWRLRHRWSARVAVTDGDLPAMLQLIQTFMQRSLLLPGWNIGGRATLELQAGARHWPISGEAPWVFIEKGRISFSEARLSTGSGRPELRLNGSLAARGERWAAEHLVASVNRSRVKITGAVWPFPPTPRLDFHAAAKSVETGDFAAAFGRPTLVAGPADLELSARGPIKNPVIDLRLSLPTGRLSTYLVQQAELQTHYEKNRWSLSHGSIHLWNGTVQAKGELDTANINLKVWGENLSLAQAFPASSPGNLGGLLKFSGHVTGGWSAPDGTGVLSIAELTLGTLPPVDVHGDFTLGSFGFKTEILSADQHFDLGVSGTQETGGAHSVRVSGQLPDGSSLTGHAVWTETRLQGQFATTHLRLPGLLRPLMRWTPGLAGNVSGHGELGGTLRVPTVEGSLESDNLTAGGEALGPAKMIFQWSGEQLSIPDFTLGTSVHGALESAPGRPWVARVNCNGAAAQPLLRVVAPHAELPGALSGKVIIHNDSLEVHDAHFQAPQGQASFSGTGRWPRRTSSGPVESVQFEANGDAASSDGGQLWNFPFNVKGHCALTEKGEGVALVRASHVTVRSASADPFEGTVEWDRTHLYWRHTHWGAHWNSEGSLRFQSDSPLLAARLDVADASITSAARWLGWAHPEEIDGALRGSFTASGTLAQPRVAFVTHLTQARWRAYHFQSDLSGDWAHGADAAIHLMAHLQNGGQFNFQGLLHPDSSVLGDLQLEALDLAPLGQSFALPEALVGSVRGSLAVKGPIDRLEFLGHVEGGPAQYGGPDQHPFRLEKFFLDLAVAPSPEHPGFTRMTLSKGWVKTTEEEIRWRSGSYAEFAKGREASLRLGADLRNLHLGVFTIFGGVDLDGAWQIKPAGFAIEGDLSTRSLFINDYELEKGHVSVDYYDNVLHFSPPALSPPLVTGTVDLRRSPEIQFTDFLLSGRGGQGLQLSGAVGPTHWDFHMTGKGLDVGTLAGLAGFPYPLSGSANLTIRGAGDFVHPHLEGTLALSQGSALGLTYTSGEAALVWQNDRVTFTALSLSYPGRYKLQGSGSFPLNSQRGQPSHDPKIDFSVRLADSNLSLLQSLSTEIKKARGDVQGIVQVTGTSTRPVMHGSLRVKNGDVVGAHYFRRLQNLLLAIDFDGDKILLRELQGDSEGGTLLAGGAITLHGFVPSAYDLHADITSAKGLGVQVPELAIPESPLAKRFHFLTTISQAKVKGHMSFQGPADAPVFKGHATIFNGHFTFPPSRKNPPPPAIVDWFRRINWDASLNFQDGAWFENEYVQANLVGKLDLKGPGDALKVDGSLDIGQGEISYLGLEFDIRQARFDALSKKTDNGVTNTLFVSGVAESQVQATDTLNGANSEAGNRLSFNDKITLTIDRAPVDEVKPRLTSANNPNLSQEKVLARATQIDLDNLTPQERTYVYQQAMIQILDTSLATPLAKSFLKRTGLVDNFRVQRVIDPSGVSPVVASPNTPNTLAPVTQNPFANTKYTVEKDLFNRVTVGYGVRFVPVLTPDLQDRLNLVSDVQLSYRWFKNVYVKGDVDLPSSNSGIVPERRVTIEPTFRFGWWGNTNATPKRKVVPPPALLPSVPSDSSIQPHH